MPIATKTTAMKSDWLAVFGIQVSLKENFSVWRISCQIGGPGRPWTLAMAFLWMPW